MRKHSFHIGGIHSNYKFGVPTPRTSRQAFGSEMETSRPEDNWVGWVVLVCVVIGFVVEVLSNA